MNWLTANVRDFRSAGKSCSISVRFLLLIFLLSSSAYSIAAGVAASSATAVDVAPGSDDLFDSFDDGVGDVAEEFENADNVEWHHVRIVDGVMREDHPVVMYKEDFVSEDFDPTKNSTNSSSHSAESSHAHSHAHSHRRKYSNISHKRRRVNHTDTTQYRAVQPEKIYFDVLPEAPVVVSDETDSKFDPLRVEVISLLDEDDTQQHQTEAPSKHLLSKHPKKYHHRIRRDTTQLRHKRNPYYRHRAQVEPENNSVAELLKQIYGNSYGQIIASHRRPERHPVQGKLWNALSLIVETPVTDKPSMVIDNRFGGEDNTDRVVWGANGQANPSRRIPPTTAPSRRPSIPLFHDSNPQNADFGFITRRPAQTAPIPATNQRPTQQQRPAQQPPQQSVPTAPRRDLNVNAQRPESNEVAVSECVWAIVSCCSRKNNKVRYYCFEEFGCRGAFWDLNPCADNIRNNAISYVSNVYE